MLVSSQRRFVSFGRNKVFNPKRQKPSRLAPQASPVHVDSVFSTPASPSSPPKAYSSQTTSLVVAAVTGLHAYLAWRYHDDIKEYLFGIKKPPSP